MKIKYEHEVRRHLGYNKQGLVPVDTHVKSLQKKIDSIWWENPDEDSGNLLFLERELEHFLTLRSDGVIYEPNF